MTTKKRKRGKLTKLVPINKANSLYQLLGDKSRWCKGRYAVDVEGVPSRLHSDASCRFCLVGAIAKVHYINIADYARDEECKLYLKCIWETIQDLYPKIVSKFKIALDMSDHDKIVMFNDHKDVTFTHIKKIINKVEF